MNKHILGIGLAAAVAGAAILPASAAPVLSSTATVKDATSAQTTEVRWRSGAAVAAGVGAGLAIGALAASQPRYYDPYYGAPAYGYGYGYYDQPAYYGSAPYYGGYYGYGDGPYYGSAYGGSGYSQKWYNGRRDTNTSGNW